MPGRTKNAKNMTAADDAAAYKLAMESKWSYRRIGRQMGRSDKAIAAAIVRYEQRISKVRSTEDQIDNGLLSDAQIAHLELFCAWLEEGRQMGWARLLLAGMGPTDLAKKMA